MDSSKPTRLGRRAHLPFSGHERPALGLQLEGYGQNFQTERDDGKLVIYVMVKDAHKNEGFLQLPASKTEIHEIIKEFQRHFRNKARRECHKAETKKFEVAVIPYTQLYAA